MADDGSPFGGLGQIPLLKNLSGPARQKVAMAAAFTVLAVLMMALLLQSSQRGPFAATSPTPSATPSTQTSSYTQPPDVNPTEAPEATPSPTSQATYEGEENGDVPEVVPVKPPVYAPSSSRSPGADDKTQARIVLNKIVPAWASITTTETGSSAWTDTWAREPESSQPFLQLSVKHYYDLWAGTMQMGATAKAAKIVSAKQLWNAGSDSMWRVTVERDIQSVEGDAISQAEELTWDFQVRQPEGGGQFQIVSYSDPQPANDEAGTYRPPY